MRALGPVGLVLAAVMLWAAPAAAENRTFIIANNADGYGVDRCLATGASCGATVARAYCRSQAFADARSFRKVAQSDITASVAEKTACRGSCGELVAIECTR